MLLIKFQTYNTYSILIDIPLPKTDDIIYKPLIYATYSDLGTSLHSIIIMLIYSWIYSVCIFQIQSRFLFVSNVCCNPNRNI